MKITYRGNKIEISLDDEEVAILSKGFPFVRAMLEYALKLSMASLMSLIVGGEERAKEISRLIAEGAIEEAGALVITPDRLERIFESVTLTEEEGSEFIRRILRREDA